MASSDQSFTYLLKLRCYLYKRKGYFLLVRGFMDNLCINTIETLIHNQIFVF